MRRIKNQTVAYRESDRTLYVGDLLGTTSFYTVGDERIGVFLLARPFPPRALADYDPRRIIVGQGTGVFEDAAAALDDAIAGAQRFPRELITNGVMQLRATAAAIRHSPSE